MNPEKKKLVCENYEVEIYLPRDDSPICSCQESETRSSIFNLFFSQSIGLLILLSRGNYAAYVSLIRAAVIFITSSFVGASVSLLFTGLMPRHVTIRRCSLRISSASLAAALLILACILFMEIFRLVYSGINSWQLMGKEEILSLSPMYFKYSGRSVLLRKNNNEYLQF